MKYRILGEPMEFSYSNYKGLYREEPIYINEVNNDEQKKLAEYWEWYATEAGDGGYVTDLSRAIELVKAYKLLLDKDYEVIKFSQSSNQLYGEELLGIDICTPGGYSYLSWGLEFIKIPFAEMQPIFALIELYFRPKLNRFLLLDHEEDAILLVKLFKEIQDLKPGILETDQIYYYYVYKIIF